MSTELKPFDIPHVFLRIMAYLPKSDQKAVALADKKLNKMAFAFNFWYYGQHKQMAARDVKQKTMQQELVKLEDQFRRTPFKARNGVEFARKMKAVVTSLPKKVEVDVMKFCTPLGLSFLGKVESDLKNLKGDRTLRMIRNGHMGQNLLRAVSTFSDVALPLIEAEIQKYEEEEDESLLELVAAHEAGTLDEFIEEYREDLFEAYKQDQASKRIDITDLNAVDDNTLRQYCVSLVSGYNDPKNKATREAERQNLLCAKERLAVLDVNKENRLALHDDLHKESAPQSHFEPLSMSPPLSPH